MPQVTIELGREDKNMDVFVAPLKQTMMGRFSRNNIPHGTVAFDDKSNMAPDLPGWRITIDPHKRSVKIFHPFDNTQAGKRAQAEFRKAYGKGFDASVPVSVPDNGDMRDLDEGSLQEWMMWAYRVTHGNKSDLLATVVDGEFPKGLSEAVAKDRQFDVNLRTARERIERERALEMMETDARTAVGATAK